MSYIALVYADLIRKGLKQLEDVPAQLQEEVRVVIEKDQSEHG